MNYDEFLFSQLLQEYDEYFKKMPYDELFDKAQKLYAVFKNSEYNDDTIGIYEAIEQYLNDNIDDIVKGKIVEESKEIYKLKLFIKEVIEESNIINKKWYNSHGKPMTMEEFIELEVYERENYTIDEVKEWMDKYNIDYDDYVIWVTDYDNCNSMYCERGYGTEPIEINPRDIIVESYDGDYGYLAVI